MRSSSPHQQQHAMQTLELIGSIDEGTERAKFTLYNHKSTVVASHSVPTKQLFPQAGWCEQEPEDILASVIKAAEGAGKQLAYKRCVPRLAAVGIANQRETVLVWDRATGRPLHRAIVWTDTRTEAIVCELEAQLGGRQALLEKTGLPLSNEFSGPKLLWLQRHVPEVKAALEQRSCCVGTVDSWLVWNLTGGSEGGRFVTDLTNASRTMLMDIKTRQWDPMLCGTFGVPLECLPDITSNCDHFGTIKNTNTLLDGAAITAVIGSQQAACVGQGLFSRGMVKCTYGPGAFLMMNTGTGSPLFSKSGLISTPLMQLGAGQPVTWGLEGVVATAGLAVSWLINQMGIIKSLQETEEILRTTPDSDGVVFVPGFSGPFSQKYKGGNKGMIMGLTQASTKAQIVRALFEAICFEMQEVLECMRSDTSVSHVDTVLVDGGMSRNAPFMQLTADLLRSTVQRGDAEATSLGAALLAGVSCGYWSMLKEVDYLVARGGEQFHPQISERVWNERVARWNDVMRRVAGPDAAQLATLRHPESTPLGAKSQSQADMGVADGANGSCSLQKHH